MAKKKTKPPAGAAADLLPGQIAITADPATWPKPWDVWPLHKIKPYPNNPRTHPPTQVTLLALLLKKYGPDQNIVVDENGIILKGHGRLMAAQEAEYAGFPITQRFGMTEADKRAMRIADNQVSLLSGWDHVLMQTEVTALNESGYNMSLLAFDRVELAQWQAGDGIEQEADPDKGKLLELVNVTIADPKHKVERLDHYVLSDTHHMLCVSVITDWAIWRPLLVEHSLFCPYPGVFVPFASKAKKHTLIMIQPDPYIAGHILDRWVEAHGKKSIRKVVAP